MNSSNFTNTDIYSRGASTKLIVFLHGYGPFARRHLKAITKVITGESISIRTGWTRLAAILKWLGFLCLAALVVAFVWYLLHHDWSHVSHARLLLIGAIVLVVVVLGVLAIPVFLLALPFIMNWGDSEDESDRPGAVNSNDSRSLYADDSLGAAIDTVVSEEPDADLLVPFYDASFFSNADPLWLASRLEDLIARSVEYRTKRGGQYKEIVLIGHSIGALLIRKAYVYALGATDDHPVSSEHPQPPKDWSAKVDRLILFAPMNRGWDIRPRPRHMGIAKFLFYWFILISSSITGRARLLRDLRRGTVFVSNLRIQWARLCRRDDVTVAPMIMLLGDVDDLVSQADHQDVSASANFIHIPVASSGHGTIVRFHTGRLGKIRTESFRKALTYTIKELKDEYFHSTEQIRDSAVEIPQAHASDNLKAPGPVVFVMHGIRDRGHWTRGVGRAIKAVDAGVKPITSSYGYFPILRFLFLNARHRKVRLFMDWYANVVAASGEQDISYIGHSNGTFIVAAALKRYTTVRFKNIALLASIVPCDFPWDSFIARGRVSAIRTDLSADDPVVALFGGFFEVIRQNSSFDLGSFGEIGSSGFDGFHEDSAHTHEPKYFPSGHGGPVIPANFASLAKFAVTGESEVDAALLVPDQSRLVSLLDRFSIFAMPLIFCVIILTGYLLSLLIHHIWHVQMLIPAICYSILILAILLFV